MAEDQKQLGSRNFTSISEAYDEIGSRRNFKYMAIIDGKETGELHAQARMDFRAELSKRGFDGTRGDSVTLRFP